MSRIVPFSRSTGASSLYAAFSECMCKQAEGKTSARCPCRKAKRTYGYASWMTCKLFKVVDCSFITVLRNQRLVRVNCRQIHNIVAVKLLQCIRYMERNWPGTDYAGAELMPVNPFEDTLCQMTMALNLGLSAVLSGCGQLYQICRF